MLLKKKKRDPFSKLFSPSGKSYTSIFTPVLAAQLLCEYS